MLVFVIEKGNDHTAGDAVDDAALAMQRRWPRARSAISTTAD